MHQGGARGEHLRGGRVCAVRIPRDVAQKEPLIWKIILPKGKSQGQKLVRSAHIFVGPKAIALKWVGSILWWSVRLWVLESVHGRIPKLMWTWLSERVSIAL